ncbi:isoprenoid synthase domain-containing protein [Abortiporus biennis]|nr:isoprenoid synthase domain-containing protein [Abortiporus biennis]
MFVPTLPKTFVIPDFFSFCPFRYECNPYHDISVVQSRDWIASYGLFDADRLALFHKGEHELLASYAYPDADLEHIRTCHDYINLLIAVDDVADEQDSDGATHTMTTCIKAFRNPEWDDGTNLTRMCKDFLKKLEGTAHPNVVERFIVHTVDYLAACAQESRNRQANHVLTMLAYEPLRRNNGATLPCFDLTEYCYGICLPDDVFDDFDMINMRMSSTDLINYSNDCFSFDKEQASGHYGHNLVSVMMRDKQCDLQTSNDLIGAHCKALTDGFLESKEHIRSYGAEDDKAIALYIKGLEAWVWANLIWSFKSKRYFKDKSEEIMRTRTVTVSPRRKLAAVKMGENGIRICTGTPEVTPAVQEKTRSGIASFISTRFNSLYTAIRSLVHQFL